jgi:hypothetical protein
MIYFFTIDAASDSECPPVVESGMCQINAGKQWITYYISMIPFPCIDEYLLIYA